jgi:hypothetical protein
MPSVRGIVLLAISRSIHILDIAGAGMPEASGSGAAARLRLQPAAAAEW